MEKAPFFNDVAEGPENHSAYWVNTTDNIRLRITYWPGGDKGTIFLFQGRNEFSEKYGLTAAALTGMGYHVLTLDWRGQGLSDRLIPDKSLGHVDKFSDYQLDVAALGLAADILKCPRPRFLIAHSMGGCIGLRALNEALPVKAAAFSSPMWGIQVGPALRPFAIPFARAATKMGKGLSRAPGTSTEAYVNVAPFEDNSLTSDPDMYAYMQKQALTHPELHLAGPTIHWFTQAYEECETLQRIAPPSYPVVTFVATNERIVDPDAIKHIMKNWKRGDLKYVRGAEHELMMEQPKTRSAFYSAADALFFNNSR